MEYNRYFILVSQMRADGDVNFVKVEKYSFASAMAEYYAQKAKYYTDTTYPQVGIAVTNADLSVIEQCVVTTQYVAPTTE